MRCDAGAVGRGLCARPIDAQRGGGRDAGRGVRNRRRIDPRGRHALSAVAGGGSGDRGRHDRPLGPSGASGAGERIRVNEGDVAAQPRPFRRVCRPSTAAGPVDTQRADRRGRGTVRALRRRTRGMAVRGGRRWDAGRRCDRWPVGHIGHAGSPDTPAVCAARRPVSRVRCTPVAARGGRRGRPGFDRLRRHAGLAAATGGGTAGGLACAGLRTRLRRHAQCPGDRCVPHRQRCSGSRSSIAMSMAGVASLLATAALLTHRGDERSAAATGPERHRAGRLSVATPCSAADRRSS